MKWKNPFSNRDIAIDLGTANTRVFFAQDEHWIETASRLIDSGVDQEFREPLQKGAVTDSEAAKALLQPLVVRKGLLRLRPLRALVCCPTDATSDERHLLEEAVQGAGVQQVRLVHEPFAAAVGAGWDLSERSTRIVIDIGDGVTDMALFRAGQMTGSAALRTGCSDLHAALGLHLREQYDQNLSWSQLEQLTRKVQWSANQPGLENSPTQKIIVVQNLAVALAELLEVLRPIVRQIITFIRSRLYSLSSQEMVEAIENKILLTGGGVCLRGMPQIIAEETNMPIKVAQDPLHSVIQGAHKILCDAEKTGLWQPAFQS